MNDEQKQNLEKIKKLTDWMNDLDPTLYQVQAQYVVILTLLNYIETLGMFLIGYFKKDEGNTSEPTSCSDRFESFFSYFGPQYKKLIDNGKSLDYDVYNELRCGLTHEMIPKKYKFCIFHVGTDNDWYKKSDEEKERIKKEKIGILPCGVIFDTQNKIWLIFVHKLLYDFNKAKYKLINEIENGNEELLKNFDEVVEAINLKNFVVPKE